MPCVHQVITGEPCPSCGLSHAFSLIVRGRVDEALQWNSHSMRVFLFFALQLIMRIALGTRTLITETGAETDSHHRCGGLIRHGAGSLLPIPEVTVADALLS
ncbi:MAG: DUF2752 domain-containing protein [Marinilabiliales bacterium]|nr:DUF2752 domain-containing protein [Marinilabiliales bacterium]